MREQKTKIYNIATIITSSKLNKNNENKNPTIITCIVVKKNKKLENIFLAAGRRSRNPSTNFFFRVCVCVRKISAHSMKYIEDAYSSSQKN